MKEKNDFSAFFFFFLAREHSGLMHSQKLCVLMKGHEVHNMFRGWLLTSRVRVCAGPAFLVWSPERVFSVDREEEHLHLLGVLVL